MNYFKFPSLIPSLPYSSYFPLSNPPSTPKLHPSLFLHFRTSSPLLLPLLTFLANTFLPYNPSLVITFPLLLSRTTLLALPSIPLLTSYPLPLFPTLPIFPHPSLPSPFSMFFPYFPPYLPSLFYFLSSHFS